MPSKKKQRDEARELVQKWHDDRERARTDLYFLMRDVLGYNDVTEYTHSYIVDACQKFKGCEDLIDLDAPMFSVPSIAKSTPRVYHWDLEPPGGCKDVGLFAPRGSLKTSIQTVAHSIQWIINYPNIRILIDTATEKLATLIMVAISQHFERNVRFRFLFPEFCPEIGKRVGNNEQFTVPNRTDTTIKEPTVMLITLTTSIAGPHFEVIKHSDVLTDENSKTIGGLEAVKDHYRYCNPLIERGTNSKGEAVRAWRTIEGTIFDLSDAHNELCERELAKSVSKRTWYIVKLDAEVHPTGKGVLWPERYPMTELQKMLEEIGDYIYGCQMRLNPQTKDKQLTDKIVTFPGRFIKSLLPRYVGVYGTIDLAGMEDDKTDGSRSALTVAGFDRQGRMDVLEIMADHYTVFEVIEAVFALQERFPELISFKIEKQHHAQVLLPFLTVEMDKRETYVEIEPIPRDNQISKVNRILGLQPWFRNNRIRFADTCTSLREAEDEVTKFPAFKFKDILDTLADQMQNSTNPWGVNPDLNGPPQDDDESIPTHLRPFPGLLGKFDGFNEMGTPIWSDDNEFDHKSSYHRLGM